ncbi:integrase catalytic domain-containing protein [Trichonephila clavipes]|nr:integrase catalytic domain-containing protein [Trichonephila clavipes]
MENTFIFDNDPKPTAIVAKTWLLYHAPRQLETSPQSPDLNPIENLWVHLATEVGKKYSTGNFPLTPSHFLLGRRLASLPAVKLSTVDCVVDKEELLKRFNYHERLLNNFWRQRRKDYLLNLKSAHFVNPTKETEFKINDIVLREIHDDRLPRSIWKLGKVIETFTGRDKRIRACAVKTENSVIRRPVQLLHNLEIPN